MEHSIIGTIYLTVDLPTTLKSLDGSRYHTHQLISSTARIVRLINSGASTRLRRPGLVGRVFRAVSFSSTATAPVSMAIMAIVETELLHLPTHPEELSSRHL